MAGNGRTVVHVAVDGQIVGLIAVADAPRETAREAISALSALGLRSVMLTGDNRATAERIAATLGIDEVLAEVLPADKAAKVAGLQHQGRKVAMVGDGVNDAPALAQADVGIAIGAGTDVAIETADVVLMRSDPLDVATAVQIGRGTVRKMRQNLGWAIGYNSLALPIAAGVFEPFGFTLRPEIGAISMSGSSVLVALNALSLRRLPLPDDEHLPPDANRSSARERNPNAAHAGTMVEPSVREREVRVTVPLRRPFQPPFASRAARETKTSKTALAAARHAVRRAASGFERSRTPLRRRLGPEVMYGRDDF
jgi:P-type Cu2+ transporter